VPGPSPLNRIAAADVAAVLERVSGVELAAQGGINVISVEAIRDKVGGRWEKSRPGVWAYVQMRMAEHLQSGDMFHRVGDTDFLIAMTSEQGAAAQTIALKILEEVLVHFLGAADPADLRLRTVTKVTPDELSCEVVDPRVVAVARRKMDAPDSPHRLGVNPAEEKRRNPVSFVTASGARLKIEFSLEHLISLRHQVTAAIRVEPRVTDLTSGRVMSFLTLSRLSDADLARIDQATIDYGALFLPVEQKGPRAPLILPTSFRTMMASKGRSMLIAAASQAPDLVRTGILVELIDVNRGTPPGRLVEVVGLLGTLTRGVFVRGGLEKDALEPLRGSRLSGVTLDIGDMANDPSRLASSLLDFGKQARGLAPAIAVQGLRSDDYFAVAEVAGMSHASVRETAAGQSSRSAA
jgi:GGDEF domain-containing protein